VSRGPDADGVFVLGVSELVELLRGTLRDVFGEVRVEGEIASLFRSRPGHLYFDLKDEGALLRAVMFRVERRGSASSPATACSCRRAGASTSTASAAPCARALGPASLRRGRCVRRSRS
jgi:exodeoxyribonuclease VII large subunit